jgi:large subunit ribosomal protein L13
MKSMNLETMLEKNPERVIMKSVKGMLPKNKLGNAMLKKLRVCAGPEHNHISQKPEVLEL